MLGAKYAKFFFGSKVMVLDFDFFYCAQVAEKNVTVQVI